MRKTNLLLLLTLLACVLSLPIRALADELTRVPVFEMNTDGSKYYRIPALGVAKDGTLIAVADKRGSSLSDLPNTISVVAKRSTDNGNTWSEAQVLAQGNSSTQKTYGDPAIVVDRETGTILVMFVGDYGFWASRNPVAQRSGLYYVKSADNGLTWSEPVRFDDQVYKSNWQGGFVASGAATQLKSGRIMAVVNAHTSTVQGSNQDQYAIWTDDLGETWHSGSTPSTPAGNGNESKLLELENGNLLMSIRCSGTRMYSISTDGGNTWGELKHWSDMVAADCNGDIIRYSGSEDGQSRILHSVPNASTRHNVSVFMSYDEANTWPVKKLIYDGPSAYSSLAVLPNGEIGCFVEEGKWDNNIDGEDGFTLAFYRFSLDWLTDNADSGEAQTGTLVLDGSRWMTIDASQGQFNIPSGGKMTITGRFKKNDGGRYGLVTNRTKPGTNNAQVSGIELITNSHTTTTSAEPVWPNVNLSKGSWENVHGQGWASNGISVSYTTGEWAHFAYVIDLEAGYNTVYYNGDKELRVSTGKDFSYPLTQLADMLVGCRYTCVENQSSTPGWEPMNGEIDDIRFFNYAMTAEQAAADMTSTVDANTEGLIAAYDFNEIKGWTVKDISGNGYDGTLVNFPEYVVGHALTITEPDAAEGTLEVWNGDTRVLSGRNVAEGTVLEVRATPAEGYAVAAIKVNGEALPAGTTTFTMEEPSTVSVEFVTVCTVTIVPAANGTLKVMNGTEEVTSGQVVEEGTVLTLEGTAAEGYELGVFAANGSAVHGTELTVVRATTITGYFYDKAFVQPVTGEYEHREATVSRSDRYISELTVTDGVSSMTVAATGSTGGRQVYADRSENVFMAVPGATITVTKSSAAGEWMHSYLFMDLNRDGQFSADVDANGVPTDGSELLAFDKYNPNGTDNGYINSFGEDVGNGHTVIASSQVPAFTLPADMKPGDYRVRYKLDWNSIDPNGSTASGNLIEDNSGAIIDFTIRIPKLRTVTVASGNAEAGSVAITAPAAEGLTSPLTIDPVTVEATATADNATFMNWSDESGLELTTASTYTYNGYDFATLTANFHVTVPEHSVAFTAEGNGELTVYTEFDAEAETLAGAVESGAEIAEGTELYALLVPAQGEEIESVMLNEQEQSLEGLRKLADGSFVLTLTVESDVTLAVTFTENASSLTGIEAANGEAEYFNLQGMRVAAESLTTGIYVRSQNGKSTKVLVK